MAGGIARDAEAARDTIIRIAVDTIGADFRQQAGDRFRETSRFGARALVPRHVGEEDADVPPVKLVHHLLERREAARHVAKQVELVAVVDADIGVDGPEQYAVDAAVTAVEVIEKAVDGVLAAGRIVKVAVFHHGLRLYEGALGPLELGARVDFTRESGAYAALGAVAGDFGEPVGGGFLGGRAGDLLAVGRISGVLCESGEGEQADRDEPLPDAIRIQ